jgi:ABC-2 type transport system permease protein
MSVPIAGKSIRPQSLLAPTLQFSLTILRASFKNTKAVAATLGLPLFMLLMFWITTRTDRPGDFDLMGFMFPAIVALSVMLAGLTQATRLAEWRAQGVFARLALTPLPLAYLVLGAALAQVVMGVVQGISVLLLGAVLGMIFQWQGAVLILAVSTLAAATFIAFGSLIASFTGKADLAAYVFFATFMPLFFLGSFPREMLPASMGAILPWLPTSMVIELISSLFAHGTLPDNGLFLIAGFLVYGLLFGVIAARRFRWEA